MAGTTGAGAGTAWSSLARLIRTHGGGSLVGMTKIGVIGSGIVSETLAQGFLKHGYEVMRGSRDPQKLATWKQGAGASARVGTFEETARFGELVVLAVKGTAAEQAVALCGPANLAGKPVLDTTNPIADAPPVQGVLSYFTVLRTA